MRNHVFFVAFLAMALVACGTSNQETTNQGEPTAAETQEETPKTATPAGDGFNIEVINGDIPSPEKKMTGKIGDQTVVIVYGSPSVKGRQVFGGLEPFGKVWRTGANKATSIEFSGDVQIEGKALPAGKYGLFTIPGEEKWTIIFNETWDQWGAYDYDKSKDVLRVEVDPGMAEESAEQMDFMIDGNKVVLRWDKHTIPFTIS